MGLKSKGAGHWPLRTRIAHAVLAATVLGAAGLALYLVNPPDWSEPFVRRYEAGIVFHKLLGLLALIAALAMLIRRPVRSARAGPAQVRRAAALVQGALLALTLVAAVSGYVSTSLFNQPLDVAGVVSIGSPLPRHEAMGGLLAVVHEIAAYALLVLATGHIGMGVLRMAQARRDARKPRSTGEGE